MLFEDYPEAENIYQKLLKYEPDNDNLKYKIGICLLKNPYRKGESIAYLLDASNNINPDYKEGSFKEKTAPPDVLYYLGSAYQVNDRLDEAIDAYGRFMKILDPVVYDAELVEQQIKSCQNAKRLKQMPVDIDIVPVSMGVNTRYADINPVVSGDGNRMAFMTKQPFFDEALFIEKIDGEWTLPMSLTSMLGFDGNVYPVGLSFDGSEILLYYDDEHIGNLYHSRYKDGFWLPAEKLGENISTKYWESHASFSSDGKSIYFTSNRKGTHGGLDIYKADRLPGGGWDVPVNLGPVVNTRYNEECPFITEDGQTLFFSSYGHYNIGGYDIFYSRKNKDGSWGEPVNLGYPVNSTDDDLFFQPVKNGNGGYQARVMEGGEGKYDIYYLEIYSENNPRIYLVTGSVRTEDGKTDPSRLQMYVIDEESGDTIKYLVPIDNAGRFEIELSQGNYSFLFRGEGYEELIKPLIINMESDKEGITLEEQLELSVVKVAPAVFRGEESMIGLKDTVFEGEAGKIMEVPVRLEEGAVLVTSIYKDSVPVSRDTMVTEKKHTRLEIVPLPGTSRVVLEMTDGQGNIHVSEFTMIGIKPVPRYPSRKERETATAGETGVKDAGAAAGDTAGGDTAGEAAEFVPLELLIEETRMGPELLKQLLTLYAEGSLKEYLEGLDLDAANITSPEELVRHLEQVAGEQGFTMEEARVAMLKALEQITTVARVYEELLASSGEITHEILDGMDLEAEGICTMEQLIGAIYRALVDDGRYSRKEIRELLREMFPGHHDFIAGLEGRNTGTIVALALSVAALLILLIFLWMRRRKKEK
jgi:tetratricopeptide (TPR) repeat protein